MQSRAPVFHSHALCRMSDVTCSEPKESGKEKERWREEGWNNLNKTEGQPNNKMSIPPPSSPDVNFLFLSDLVRCVNEGWGRGWF